MIQDDHQYLGVFLGAAVSELNHMLALKRTGPEAAEQFGDGMTVTCNDFGFFLTRRDTGKKFFISFTEVPCE